MPDVEPLIFSSLVFDRQPGEANINAEDAFYCDPVIGDVTFDIPVKIHTRIIDNFEREPDNRNNYHVKEDEKDHQERSNIQEEVDQLADVEFTETRISVHSLEEQIVQQPGMYENVCSVS